MEEKNINAVGGRIGEISSLQVNVCQLEDQLKETENRVEKIVDSNLRQVVVMNKITDTMFVIGDRTINNNKSIKYVAISNFIIALTLFLHILFS